MRRSSTSVVVAALLALVSGTSWANLKDVSATIDALRSSASEGSFEIDIPSQASYLLTQLKHQLRDALVDAANVSRSRTISAAGLRDEFMTELRRNNLIESLCENPPSRNNLFGLYPMGNCPHVVIDNVRIERLPWHPDLLVVVTTLGIPCGTDSSLYILKRQKSSWVLILSLEANGYRDISGAMGAFSYAISPPQRDGQFWVVTADINPWCSSNWQSIRIKVLRVGLTPEQPVSLVSREGTIFLGWGGYKLSAVSEGFELLFEAEQSLDFGILIRKHVWNFKVQGKRAYRIDPIALKPEDFVDEWTGLSWEEAGRWSNPSNSTLNELHTMVRHFQDRYIPEIDSVQYNGNGLWEVEVDFLSIDDHGTLDESQTISAHFTVSKQGEHFSMEKVSLDR